MSESFTLSGFPDVNRFSLSATPNNATAVNIKTGTKRVSIQFITSPGKLAFTGTDDVAIGTDYMTIPANEIVELLVPADCDVIYVASATASVVCEIVIENR